MNKEDIFNYFYIFVGDFFNEVNDEVFFQVFFVFGLVFEVCVMWDMKIGCFCGYGFVVFCDCFEVEKVLSFMDGEWFGFCVICCNWVNQKGQFLIVQQQVMQQMGMILMIFYGYYYFFIYGVYFYDMIVNQILVWQIICYVGNLILYIIQNDLVLFFQNFGFVVEFCFQVDCGFVFIKMDIYENVVMVICQLNGYNVNGCFFKCSVCIIFLF